MVDLSDALSSAASVQVQAHRDPIADARYNLHQPTPEKFDRLKARWPEPVNIELEDALALFNFKPLHPLRDYCTAAAKLQEHFIYSVDSLILTPGLEFIQHLPTNEFLLSFPNNDRRSQYLTWLKSSLAQVDSL